MEIERKFIITKIPDEYTLYPYTVIEQGYIYSDPVIRVRRSDNRYILTIKGRGKMAREEFELPLSEEAYRDLLQKTEGNIIRKKRIFIPYPPYTIELDIFEEPFNDMMMAEVEFPSVAEAESFVPPVWFGSDVTDDSRYHNAVMSRTKYPGGIFEK